MFQVTFPEVARVLQSLQSSVAAAESHGCLCGAFCTVQQYPVESWLDELVPDLEEDPADDRATLRLLFADTVRALRGDEMEFQLLLPDDDAPLVERAMALSQWCQGFLYGFGTGRPVPRRGPGRSRPCRAIRRRTAAPAVRRRGWPAAWWVSGSRRGSGRTRRAP